MQTRPPPLLAHCIAPEPLGWGWRLALMGLWALATFGTLFFVRSLEGYYIGSWPLGYWLASQGLIVLYVAIAAFYAWAANRRERQLAAHTAND